MKTTLTLLLCSLSLLGWGQKKETLAYNLEKGVTYTRTMENANASTLNMMGQSVRISSTKRTEMDFLVKEASATGYDLEVAYKTIQISETTPMGTQSFGPETEIVARILAAFKAKPVQIKMDKQGKVLDIQNCDEVFSSLTGLSPMDEAKRMAIKLTFGESALKQILEDAKFPDHPVAEGENWSSTDAANAETPTQTIYTCTFLGNENGVWKISHSGIVETPDKDAYVQVFGADLKSDMQGTATGEYKLDSKSGWILESYSHWQAKGNAHMKANGQLPPDGINVNMEMEAASKVTGKISK
jgi:hypothetical protein